MLDNFSWIVPQKVAGSARPYLSKHFKFIKDVGLKTIIDLREKSDYEVSEFKNLKVVHIPIVDFSIPSDDQIADFIKIINNPSNLPVLVHCFAGCGRTGLMVAIYLLFNNKRNAIETMDYIRALRPCSMETQEQEEFFVKFSSRLEDFKKKYQFI